jgi:Family of unknown function (DUF5677)
MTIEAALGTLNEALDPHERLIRLFAASLGDPIFHKREDERVFRYAEPGVQQFCLLKAIRALSAINASIELARKGYTQEIAVLIRTLVECTTHIEFVLETGDEEHQAIVKKYVTDFFADQHRNPSAEIRKAQVRQHVVHAALGKSLDAMAEKLGETEGRRSAERLYSNVYRIYSNFVHAKYPECMDLYGGGPGRFEFHVRGMSGTIKDGENLETLQSFIVTLSICFARMIQGLNLYRFAETDPIIKAWYERTIQGKHWNSGN